MLYYILTKCRIYTKKHLPCPTPPQANESIIARSYLSRVTSAADAESIADALDRFASYLRGGVVLSNVPTAAPAAILAAMRAYPESRAVQGAACAMLQTTLDALDTLCPCCPGGDLFQGLRVGSGGMGPSDVAGDPAADGASVQPLLLAALTRFPQDFKVQREGIGALCRSLTSALCSSSAAAEALIKGGAIEVSYSALRAAACGPPPPPGTSPGPRGQPAATFSARRVPGRRLFEVGQHCRFLSTVAGCAPGAFSSRFTACPAGEEVLACALRGMLLYDYPAKCRSGTPGANCTVPPYGDCLLEIVLEHVSRLIRTLLEEDHRYARSSCAAFLCAGGAGALMDGLRRAMDNGHGIREPAVLWPLLALGSLWEVAAAERSVLVQLSAACSSEAAVETFLRVCELDYSPAPPPVGEAAYAVTEGDVDGQRADLQELAFAHALALLENFSPEGSFHCSISALRRVANAARLSCCRSDKTFVCGVLRLLSYFFVDGEASAPPDAGNEAAAVLLEGAEWLAQGAIFPAACTRAVEMAALPGDLSGARSNAIAFALTVVRHVSLERLGSLGGSAIPAATAVALWHLEWSPSNKSACKAAATCDVSGCCGGCARSIELPSLVDSLTLLDALFQHPANRELASGSFRRDVARVFDLGAFDPRPDVQSAAQGAVAALAKGGAAHAIIPDRATYLQFRAAAAGLKPRAARRQAAAGGAAIAGLGNERAAEEAEALGAVLIAEEEAAKAKPARSLQQQQQQRKQQQQRNFKGGGGGTGKAVEVPAPSRTAVRDDAPSSGGGLAIDQSGVSAAPASSSAPPSLDRPEWGPQGWGTWELAGAEGPKTESRSGLSADAAAHGGLPSVIDPLLWGAPRGEAWEASPPSIPEEGEAPGPPPWEAAAAGLVQAPQTEAQEVAAAQPTFAYLAGVPAYLRPFVIGQEAGGMPSPAAPPPAPPAWLIAASLPPPPAEPTTAIVRPAPSYLPCGAGGALGAYGSALDPPQRL